MGRWVAVVCAVVAAAAIGFLAGYVRWGGPAAQVQRAQQRMQEMDTEATTLRQQKRELEDRVDQISKEQERLARENEVLRKEHTTEQLLTGQGGELPAKPPK